MKKTRQAHQLPADLHTNYICGKLLFCYQKTLSDSGPVNGSTEVTLCKQNESSQTNYHTPLLLRLSCISAMWLCPAAIFFSFFESLSEIKNKLAP